MKHLTSSIDEAKLEKQRNRARPDFEPLPTSEGLQRYWIERLPSGERAVLEVLIAAYPDAVFRSDIDEKTGYMRSSRDAYIARLAAKELVEQPASGTVKASDNLFDV